MEATSRIRLPDRAGALRAPTAVRAAPRSSRAGDATSLRQRLQQTRGNHGVQMGLRDQSMRHHATPAEGVRALRSSLAVSDPRDVHEHEADQVADEVMRAPSREPCDSVGSAPIIQRQPLEAPFDREPTLTRDRLKLKLIQGLEDTHSSSAALSTAGGALLKTKPGKLVLDKLGEGWQKLSAGEKAVLIIAGSATGAAIIVGLALDHDELPSQLPAIPVGDGLSLKLSYEGPLDKPRAFAVMLSWTLRGSKNPNVSHGDAEAAPKAQRVAIRSAGAVDGAAIAPPIVSAVVNSGGGRPLSTPTRQFMESRFGHDFGHVRVHADERAAESAQAIDAAAYTVSNQIVFNANRYQPDTDSGKRLIAHELVHVVQQGDGVRNSATPAVQRKIELRPPGKGEDRSAFDRAQELVDRLNALSTSVQYVLNGRDLGYVAKAGVDAAAWSYFERTMTAFIDRSDIVPMRLVTSKEYVSHGPLPGDSWLEGYVDLDDLLASDDPSFQALLLHLLTERFHTKNYAHRMGSIDALSPHFAAAPPGASVAALLSSYHQDYNPHHQAGHRAEAELLQDLLKDPSIYFTFEPTVPTDPHIKIFKSRAEGYLVVEDLRADKHEVMGVKMWVKRRDGTHVALADFIKERGAAAPAGLP